MDLTLVEGDYGQTILTQLRDRNGSLPLAGRTVVFQAGDVNVTATAMADGFVSFVVPPALTAECGVTRCRWKIDWNSNNFSVPDQPGRLNVVAHTRTRGQVAELTDLLAWDLLWWPGWSGWTPPIDGDFLPVDPITLQGSFPDASGNNRDAVVEIRSVFGGAVFTLPPTYVSDGIDHEQALSGAVAPGTPTVIRYMQADISFAAPWSIALVGLTDADPGGLLDGAVTLSADSGQWATTGISGGVADVTQHLFVLTDSGTTLALYVDGVSIGTAATVGTLDLLQFPLFIDASFMSRMGFIGALDRVFTAPERALLLAYAQTVYATP